MFRMWPVSTASLEESSFSLETLAMAAKLRSGRRQSASDISESKALKKRIRDLEHLLGKKTMEAEILKEALENRREKTDLFLPLPFEDDSL